MKHLTTASGPDVLAPCIPGPEKIRRGRDEQRLLGALLPELAPGRRMYEHDWMALLGAVRAREPAALRELYERTHEIVFTLALRILKDPAIAEDTVLEVYRDLWLEASRYEPARESVVGWIMNLTRARAMGRPGAGGLAR